MRDLKTFFRVVLKLDDGTIEDIVHMQSRSLKRQLDLGISEWQKMDLGQSSHKTKKNICDLIRALENAISVESSFTRITGKKNISG